jgi:hypothetical protein
MTEEIHTNGKLPIPLPNYEVIDKTEEAQTATQNDEPYELEIPEYDTSQFEEIVHSNPEITTVELSSEEQIERRKLLRKIHRYSSLFKNEVKDMPLENAPTLPLTQLRVLSEDVEFMVATRKSSQASRTLFLSSCTVAETISKPFGLKLTGLTNVCAANEELLSTVDELAVKYESNMMVSVEQRLMLQMGQLCIAIHRHNSSTAEVETETSNQETSEKREKLMEDL